MKSAKSFKERSEYSVQAVTNSIRVLEALGNAEHEQSVSELCGKLGLTRSNTNKILATLEKFGYVDSNKYTGNFQLGVKTFQISQAYISKLSLPEIAMPILQSLRDSTYESACIGVMSGANVVYLRVAETNAPVRVMPRIGNVGPAYATATGKVQLAFMEEREVESLYKNPFHQYTSNTIRCMEDLWSELKIVRRQRYALDCEEYEEGVCCMAVPVKNFMGSIIAGMSIFAPVERMSEARITDTLLPQLIEAAHKLSVKFGCSG